ncbi:unnamed protein product, partial [Cuscuta epithymum]
MRLVEEKRRPLPLRPPPRRPLPRRPPPRRWKLLPRRPPPLSAAVANHLPSTNPTHRRQPSTRQPEPEPRTC